MTLRLALYTNDWAPSIGGIQTVCTALATGVSDWSKTHAGEKIEVTLVTQTPAKGMDDSRLSFAVVRRPGLRKLVNLIRSADFLHIAGPAILPLAIGWALRKPMVVEHDGYQSVCPNGLLIYGRDYTVCPGHFMAARYTKCIRCNSDSEGWARSLRGLILTFVRRWLARRATVNVAPSRHIGQRIQLPRTQLIYHGVPGTPPSVRSSSNKLEGAPACFVYVGRLVTEKGLPVLLRACRQLSRDGFGFHLKIVGDGPERSALETTAQEFGIEMRTEFFGAVAREAMPELLVNTAAVIMPSVCEDVAPLVAIEQMMQGRLVIASDIGGLGETVDGVGLKFPPGDDRALAECMRRVLEDPGLIRQMGERAKQHALDAFTEERMVAEHVRLYTQILESHANK
jgi:glycosyltransferase involved in cell wall biosynthesis